MGVHKSISFIFNSTKEIKSSLDGILAFVISNKKVLDVLPKFKLGLRAKM